MPERRSTELPIRGEKRKEIELDANHLRQPLNLGDGDVDELVIPNGLWRSESAAHQLCLVGRLLSGRVVNFEGMCASIHSTILSIKCMDIKQLLVDRILIRFNHVIDRSRALEGCPWSFEKNVLVLSSATENKNPMQVNLNWPWLKAPIPNKLQPRITSRINNHTQFAKESEQVEKGNLNIPKVPHGEPQNRDDEVAMMALDVNEEGQHDAARMELQTDPSLAIGIVATVAGQIDKLATMENPKIFSETELFNIALIFAANGGGRTCSNRRGRRDQFRQKLPLESENEE
ncbi:UNVERIFIED_CONTAM: hypothetical protein Sradi_4918900 [Sesamum radiatum]|uniref:DUF4283 domain-containing protein n=1 Tax=Sesamum radiatum TaxID=300843 RepID=A0AAW2MFU5_SESRA